MCPGNTQENEEVGIVTDSLVVPCALQEGVAFAIASNKSPGGNDDLDHVPRQWPTLLCS